MTMFQKPPKLGIAAAVVVAASMIAPMAQAQGSKCLPRQVLVDDLQKKYNEKMTGGGLQNAKQLLEIWASPASGSFTVFITRADGLACIMATGKHWNSVNENEPKGVKS
ncbi:MAG: hypothetical protein JXR13_15390 [Thalassovita sp.]